VRCRQKTSYDLLNGEWIPVIDPDTAAHNLRLMLDRFRADRTEPLFFGDDGRPEGVVVPYAMWQQLTDLAEDAAQTERAVAVTRECLTSATPEEDVPVDGLAGEFGRDLDSDWQHSDRQTRSPDQAGEQRRTDDPR
jgi:hypothetical protein